MNLATAFSDYLDKGYEPFNIKNVTYYRDGVMCCGGMGTIVIVCDNGNTFEFNGKKLKIAEYIQADNNGGAMDMKKKPVIDDVFIAFLKYKLKIFIKILDYEKNRSEHLLNDLP